MWILKTHPTPLSLLSLPRANSCSRRNLLRVSRCGVCHTELDEIEGALSRACQLFYGHQWLSDRRGENIGQRVGVAWIASACEHVSNVYLQ